MSNSIIPNFRILFFVLINSMLSCSSNEQNKDTNNQLEEIEPAIAPLLTKTIKLSDLEILLDKTFTKEDLDQVVEDYGFQKRANGIYISNEMETTKKPKHWLKCVYMGDITNVTFSTVEKAHWDKLVAELRTLASAKPFKEISGFNAEKYSLDKYIVETYEPINGVDVELNNLYDVLIRYK